MAWQDQCYPLAAEFLDVALEDEDYTDSPGVVWQGTHQPPDDGEDGEDGEDDDSDEY